MQSGQENSDRLHFGFRFWKWQLRKDAPDHMAKSLPSATINSEHKEKVQEYNQEYSDTFWYIFFHFPETCSLNFSSHPKSLPALNEDSF